MLCPTVNTHCMEIALKHFVKNVDPDNQKIIVLIVDNARWHISKKLKIPDHLLIMTQPAYTPELSPVEPMVKKVKLPLANKNFTHLDDLENTLIKECQRLNNNPEEIKSQTSFPWIQNVLKSF